MSKDLYISPEAIFEFDMCVYGLEGAVRHWLENKRDLSVICDCRNIEDMVDRIKKEIENE